LVLFLIPLQFVHLFCNLSKCILLFFSCISTGMLCCVMWLTHPDAAPSSSKVVRSPSNLGKTCSRKSKFLNPAAKCNKQPIRPKSSASE
jgi:hypothetical protein